MNECTDCDSNPVVALGISAGLQLLAAERRERNKSGVSYFILLIHLLSVFVFLAETYSLRVSHVMQSYFIITNLHFVVMWYIIVFFQNQVYASTFPSYKACYITPRRIGNV